MEIVDGRPLGAECVEHAARCNLLVSGSLLEALSKTTVVVSDGFSVNPWSMRSLAEEATVETTLVQDRIWRMMSMVLGSLESCLLLGSFSMEEYQLVDRELRFVG